MARIVVLTMAYRGDVHPYVPVATELVRRGHDVTFVVPREFHAELASEPFTCVHSGSDFGPTELNKHGDWIAHWGMKLGGARLLQLYFGKFTVPYLDAQFAAVKDAAKGADVLFSHSTAGIIGAMAAEANGIPWISGDLFPMLIPTATRSFAPQVPSLGQTINRMGWTLARSARPNRLTFASDFARFRRRHGLDDTLRGPIDLRISPHLNLGMASPHYLPPAPDWPDNYVMTGFTHWANAAGEMPDGLQEFLAADDPPLLITLGTLAASSHPGRFEAAVEAADKLGLRSVSLCSLPETATRLRSTFDPARHGAWAFAPLSKVLGSVRGVIHSGAHGTNSMTLAAGLPSVIIPSIFDQVWHAKRQVELGTGLYAKRTKDLPDAIAAMIGDPEMAARTRQFADLLAAENGVTATANQIEAFLRR
jgi:UDP:flavonoid glycosyltransferase YjiC (YdhE family)